MRASKRPLIGVLSSYELDQHYFLPAYPRLTVNQDYTRSLTEAGALPLILPLQTEGEMIRAMLELVDGVLFVGGADVDPQLYGEEPLQKCGVTEPLRDQFEKVAYPICKEVGLPLFGVCRGLQLFNVLEGGTLKQDLSYLPTEKKHWAEGQQATDLIHAVSLEEDSFLTRAFSELKREREDQLLVNSFHHQVIGELAPSFRAVAHAADGVIEAIEYTGTAQFIAAVQWHPEMLSACDPTAHALFKYFVGMAQRFAEQRK